MKEKKNKKHKKNKQSKRKHKSDDSDANSSASDKWVERPQNKDSGHDEWMSMSGKIKTYTKDDIKPKLEKPKAHIDSYNPSTSSRELNPYWKDGGSGLPQTPDQFRKAKPFVKPSDDENSYFSKKNKTEDFYCHQQPNIARRDFNLNDYKRSHNWRRDGEDELKCGSSKQNEETNLQKSEYIEKSNSAFLSDEKMNKLGAKIVKAEIMGDHQLVSKLKDKLEAAREYRKNNPVITNEDDGIMLISTSASGSSRPLVKNHYGGDSQSKGGKRKAETHDVGGRCKYFSNDDKYNLSEMFQQEKYGTNYDADAELAKISNKSKNPNDDLEDIFVDEISKNRNDAKDSERERQKAINQSVKLEKSLDGCEHCFDSKNMIKHLVVSCGNKVYMAVPARKSLVKGHCIITTIQHYTCVTALDEDVWEEIMNKDVVFYETAMKLHRYPHVVINCVPLPRDVGDMASIYFKKALLECEAEWSMNKKVVDLKGKNIRKGIPKGLPYFWIDFGLDPGFAHVIEDQSMFPKTFAEEIIAGMLDLDHTVWKNPQREYGELQRKKVMEFINEWKPFESSNKN
ncbi:CWF19-like protein 2 homolog isoform X2 [Pieris brassicae]|uniref:CWF19-like protein 2 homolog isoform X2 n=1 Tax=Pieris brassicae TaxID=7116 RepID=UPI001E661392|nr:CWF19-like protein 2 homolog isoform X2 [Pieris brassicae]